MIITNGPENSGLEGDHHGDEGNQISRLPRFRLTASPTTPIRCSATTCARSLQREADLRQNFRRAPRLDCDMPPVEPRYRNRHQKDSLKPRIRMFQTKCGHGHSSIAANEFPFEEGRR